MQLRGHLHFVLSLLGVLVLVCGVHGSEGGIVQCNMTETVTRIHSQLFWTALVPALFADGDTVFTTSYSGSPDYKCAGQLVSLARGTSIPCNTCVQTYSQLQSRLITGSSKVATTFTCRRVVAPANATQCTFEPCAQNNTLTLPFAKFTRTAAPFTPSTDTDENTDEMYMLGLAFNGTNVSWALVKTRKSLSPHGQAEWIAVWDSNIGYRGLGAGTVHAFTKDYVLVMYQLDNVHLGGAVKVIRRDSGEIKWTFSVNVGRVYTLATLDYEDNVVHISANVGGKWTFFVYNAEKNLTLTQTPGASYPDCYPQEALAALATEKMVYFVGTCSYWNAHVARFARGPTDLDPLTYLDFLPLHQSEFGPFFAVLTNKRLILSYGDDNTNIGVSSVRLECD